MTMRARNRTIVGGLVIGALALAVTLLPMLASPADVDPIRDIQIVVREMAFYVEGQPDPNPTITLRADEQVRIRLRNEDAGFRHDFAVNAWSVRTRILDAEGEDVVLFRAPHAKGAESYQCTPHSAMMRGTIRIE